MLRLLNSWVTGKKRIAKNITFQLWQTKKKVKKKFEVKLCFFFNRKQFAVERELHFLKYNEKF